MPISVRDRKRLWGLSASRCAFPGCRQELIEETADGQGAVLVGQEAHIVAESADGPRGQSDLTAQQRDLYQNLILLCSRHHTVVDNDASAYPVESLLAYKAEHELWVRAQLTISLADQAILERYGEIIDEWAERALLDRWTVWSSEIANPVSPRMGSWVMEHLTDLGVWMLAIIWPDTLPELQRAFVNFHSVLIDFKTVFDEHADMMGENGAWLRAIPARPHPRRDETLRDDRCHADLIVDLMLELTRAANHVCAMVRRHVDARFRLGEGALLMSGAMQEQFLRPEYAPLELADLYPGLAEFRTVRATRDLHTKEP